MVLSRELRIFVSLKPQTTFMNEELECAIAYLLAGGYICRVRKTFVFSNKFYEEFTQQQIGLVPEVIVSEVQSKTLTVRNPKKNVSDLRPEYLRFIAACKVPRRAQSSDGAVYDLNKYSEDGLKAYSKIVEQVVSGEIDMELLIRTVQLYYASPGMKQKIGNYISQGSWVSDYQALKESLDTGTLKQHIKQETKNERTSRYR